MTDDGSIFVGATTDSDDDDESTDFTATKMGSNGVVIWTWQNGTDEDDHIKAAALSDNNSVVLVGYTDGNWIGVKQGGMDFAAVKLDANRTELWRWQEGSTKNDWLLAVADAGNGSVVLAGWSFGDWFGTSKGSYDFAAVRLDIDGAVIWRWQDGTEEDDRLTAVVVNDNVTAFLGGYTAGDWGSSNAGGNDFAGVLLNLTDGTEIWRWQNGTEKDDEMHAVAGGYNNLVAMAGFTNGSWSQDNFGDADFLAVMLNTTLSASSVLDTPAPSTASTAPALETALSFTYTTMHPSLLPTAANVSGASSSISPTIMAVVSVASVSAFLAIVTLLLVWQRRKRAPSQSPSISPASRKDRFGKSPMARVRGRGGDSPSYRPASACVSPSFLHQHQSAVHPRLSPPTNTKPKVTIDPLHSVDSARSSGGHHDSRLIKRESKESTWTNAASNVNSSRKAEVHSSNPDDAADMVSANAVEKVSNSSGASLTENHRETATACNDDSRAEAVLEAAQELAADCRLPIISEAAKLVIILVKFVNDMGTAVTVEWRLRRCHSIIDILRRAGKVLGKGSSVNAEAERILLEDVHNAIGDLVELIKTYESKNRLAQVMTSSLFKRRLEEAEVAIDNATSRLQRMIHVDDERDGADQEDQGGLHLQPKTSEGGMSKSVREILAEARRRRRERDLNQVEIPEDHVKITDELLGRGGFGAVYIADYNGRNAAAKVMEIGHALGGDDSDEDTYLGATEGKGRRKDFLLELEAMMRLRSPHTVNVYGAITTRKDQLVLVMELLTGGDLRTLIRSSGGQLPEEQARLIMKDVCAGITFLHSRETVHGDLKSANVLFDATGRAKIGDFGTSRWMQHTKVTGLLTHTTKASRGTKMSFAWAAPEVLDTEEPSYASDVYSFGVVMWEILSMDVPWVKEARPRDIMARVFKGDRLPISTNFPADLTEIMQACWLDDPEKRPRASHIMGAMKSHCSPSVES